ncbi:MAG: hypothetical protein ACTSQJ_16115 [Promethearchaeota archaeon]
MRSIKLYRVPLGLDWAHGRIWFGYLFDEVLCECCVGLGKVNWEVKDLVDVIQNGKEHICPICKGTGKVLPIIEVPHGNGYQIWETQFYLTGKNEHQYYPISPVFENPFDLAKWMSEKLTINNNPLSSEQMWYDAIEDNNVDIVFNLYRENITFAEDLYF